MNFASWYVIAWVGGPLVTALGLWFAARQTPTERVSYAGPPPPRPAVYKASAVLGFGLWIVGFVGMRTNHATWTLLIAAVPMVVALALPPYLHNRRIGRRPRGRIGA